MPPRSCCWPSRCLHLTQAVTEPANTSINPFMTHLVDWIASAPPVPALIISPTTTAASLLPSLNKSHCEQRTPPYHYDKPYQIECPVLLRLHVGTR